MRLIGERFFLFATQTLELEADVAAAVTEAVEGVVVLVASDDDPAPTEAKSVYPLADTQRRWYINPEKLIPSICLCTSRWRSFSRSTRLRGQLQRRIRGVTRTL